MTTPQGIDLDQYRTQAKELLKQGVDPSSQGKSGQTGLHFAAHSGQLETVRMLLSHHVPLEEKNMYGGTVLGQTLWSVCNEPRPDHLPIIEALIAAGAQVAPQWHEQIDEMRRQQGKRS